MYCSGQKRLLKKDSHYRKEIDLNVNINRYTLDITHLSFLQQAKINTVIVTDIHKQPI